MDRRCGVIWLACMAAAGAASAQPAAPAAEATTDSFLSGPMFGPVAATGLLTYDLRLGRGAMEASSVAHLVTGTVSASTYLFEPWLANASGTLRLSTASSRYGGNEVGVFGGTDRVSTGERFVTGLARLDVFPRSRFPFEFHVERNDSRIDGGLQSIFDFRTLNVGFSQRYRPEDGSYRLHGSYEHRNQTATGLNQSQDILTGEFGKSWKYHELSLGLSLSRAERESGESTQYQSLVSRHQYAPAGPISVDTTVNLTRTVDRLIGAPGDLRVLQWSSIGVWQPQGELYSLTGAVRGLVFRDAETGQALETLGLTLGGAYNATPNLRLTANGHVSSTHGENGSVQGVSGAVGASWQSDSYEFRGFRYDRFATVTLGAAVSGASNESHQQTLVQAQAGHSVVKSMQVDDQSTLSLQLSQTLSLAHLRTTESPVDGLPTRQRTLLHSAAVTWNAGGSFGNGYARISASDSRELGGTGARFQLVNFQLSGNYEFDRRRSLTGDLTVQRTAQVGGAIWDAGRGLVLRGDRTTSSGASGEITYRHRRLFGEPRLVFTSRIKLAQDVLRQPGVFLTIPERETRLWENQLSYGIGRLETQLLLRISEVDGRRREFLSWRAQRSFGD